MFQDLVEETEIMKDVPRGEMAVVADVDPDSDDMADTIRMPPSEPLVPHVRIVTGQPLPVSERREKRDDDDDA